MRTYASKNDAKILILPTTGLRLGDPKILPSDLSDLETITKDYTINSKLKIKDFGVRPQQINPLTGLKRFAQGDRSHIMPGTKQVLEYIANSYDKIPKAMMTTGAITHPNYNEDFRIGRIAKDDHEYGFVVVEKVNNTYFHFRHVTALKNGKFIDLGIQYNGKRIKKITTKALAVGDLHPYQTDPKHEKNSLEQIVHFQPENVFLHDTFNGLSISHHYKGKNKDAWDAFKIQGLNLEEELKYTLKAIRKYCEVTPGIVNIVASNHDEHLNRYLNEGRFINDKGNDRIGALLYAAYLGGANPLAVGMEMYKPLPKNLRFLKRDEDFKILGWQLGNHGDLGANGGRGSPTSIENANGKSLTGHRHNAFKRRKTLGLGTSTHLRVNYNRGYSNWTQTNGTVYEDGNAQLFNTINKEWKL